MPILFLYFLIFDLKAGFFLSITVVWSEVIIKIVFLNHLDFFALSKKSLNNNLVRIFNLRIFFFLPIFFFI